MSNGGEHPLPQGQFYQQQPAAQGRDRSKSTFSLKSGNSHKSGGSQGQIQYQESHQEKEAKRLHSKADPTMAMNEEQPFAAAATVGTNISNLRALQHKDMHGNPIVDPDRSNPTRSRWERPLDTIRAFEAAIDGNYKRQSYARTETESIAPGGRRGSYYAGSNTGAPTPGRPAQDSYYGRQSTYSQQDHRGNGNGYDQGGPSNGYNANRARYPQQHGQGVAPNAYGNGHSYENVTTASGSGSDPLGYSTDPSSENSSVDRIQAAAKNGGGAGEYGSYKENHYHGNGYNGVPQSSPPNGVYAPPAPAHREGALPRVPIKLGGGGGSPAVLEKQRPEQPTKRKSSFLKRFSKNHD